MKYLDNPIIGELYIIDILRGQTGKLDNAQIIGELISNRTNEGWSDSYLTFKILMSTARNCWYPGEEISLINDSSTYTSINFNIYLLNDDLKK